MAVLSSIPALSAISPVTSWMPIILVLAISIVREGVEDYGRYKLDKQSNTSQVKVFEKGDPDS